MSLKHQAVALALLIAAPAPAWAQGAFGCINLPEYARAQGALQGMESACDMTIAQARRILAAQGGGAVAEPVAPAPRVHRRHRKVREAQPY